VNNPGPLPTPRHKIDDFRNKIVRSVALPVARHVRFPQLEGFVPGARSKVVKAIGDALWARDRAEMRAIDTLLAPAAPPRKRASKASSKRRRRKKS